MGSRCSPLSMNARALALLSLAVVLCLGPSPALAQGFNPFAALQRFFRPVMEIFRPVNNFLFGPSSIQSLRSSGRDELFPADCGRDEQNKGKLCFGDPELCRIRTQMTGIHQFQGRNYWFSWQDSSSRVRNTKWDWFNARNYCRKRAWTLSASRHSRSTTGSRASWTARCLTSGLQAASATLTGATSQSSSPRTSTGGSGQQTRRRWGRPTGDSSMTGLIPEEPDRASQTTGNKCDKEERRRHAWRS